jgi:hypothetical protein
MWVAVFRNCSFCNSSRFEMKINKQLQFALSAIGLHFAFVVCFDWFALCQLSL